VRADGDIGARSEAHEADAGEQPERRGAGGHPDEVAALLAGHAVVAAGLDGIEETGAADRERRLGAGVGRRGGEVLVVLDRQERRPHHGPPQRTEDAAHDSRNTRSQVGSTSVEAARSASATPGAPSRRPAWSTRPPPGSRFW